MRLPRLLGALLSTSSVALVVACSTPADEASASQESASTGILSCRAKQEAAANKAQEGPAQGHWRYLLLGVMQPVAGVSSIRERMDLAPDNDPLGRRLDVFAFAKSAAGPDGLLSLERLVAVMKTKHGVTLSLDAIQTNGTYGAALPGAPIEANQDLRSTLYLAKYIFATAGTGVTEADVAADAERAQKARDGWSTVTLPISTPDGFGSTLDQLAAESLTGTARAQCSTPGANHLKELAREADAKYGKDGLTSFSEMAMYFTQKYGATWSWETGMSYPPGGPSSDAIMSYMGLDCAMNLLRVASNERAGVPPKASPGVVLGLASCGTIDLLALQGHGTRYTGQTATTRMGEKQYEIVMLKASVLQPKLQKLLCLDATDELKLFVPYGEHAISECAIANGSYTAAKQGLTGYGYTDNWAAE